MAFRLLPALVCEPLLLPLARLRVGFQIYDYGPGVLAPFNDATLRESAQLSPPLLFPIARMRLRCSFSRRRLHAGEQKRLMAGGGTGLVQPSAAQVRPFVTPGA